MNCNICGIKNSETNNFCIKCGNELEITRKCDVCRDTKILEPLLCGHSFCRSCLDSVYIVNNICPTCRSPFYKCLSCGSYRHDKYKCLSCHKYNKVFMCNNCNYYYYSYEELIDKCVNCGKNNIELIPVDLDNIYNILVKNKDDVNPIKKKICNICFSDKLKINGIDEIYVCEDCDKLITNPLIINEKDINKYPKISKELINPSKITICEYCFSEDIFLGLDNIFNICNNCHKTKITGLTILKEYKRYFKVLHKNIVNPQILRICNFCYNDTFKIEVIDDIEYTICTNCNSNYDSSISIYEHNRAMYPIKTGIYFNNHHKYS